MPSLRTAGFNRPAFPAINPGTTVTLAVGAASSATVAIGASLVRVVSTTACYLAFGSTPTATSSGVYLPANWPEYFVVNQTDAVAALQVSAAGTLFVTPATVTP
jgi:hypothetical protein